VALCQMLPACDWLCLVFTAASMRHTAGVKYITEDKPLNFLRSSLLLYSRTSKCTRSINGIAIDHCFPLEFAVSDDLVDVQKPAQMLTKHFSKIADS